MASLRVKPVILGRKSDLTEQHLKLPSTVTHSIYFSSNLGVNFPERHPTPTFNHPSNDPQPYQEMSYKYTFSNIFFFCLHVFSRCKLWKYSSSTCWRKIQKLIVFFRIALGESDTFLTNYPLRNSLLLFRSSSGFFSLFFLSEQVLVITCNRLWRGYRICQTSLAIKSKGRSAGILPLRISCVSILLGALSMLCCLPSSSPKFHLSNGVLAVSSFSLSLIKG